MMDCIERVPGVDRELLIGKEDLDRGLDMWGGWTCLWSTTDLDGSWDGCHEDEEEEDEDDAEAVPHSRVSID